MREAKFLDVVTQTLKNKGRVLLPVFALGEHSAPVQLKVRMALDLTILNRAMFTPGRAQEMLLILDEHWDSHPELQSIPIYYGSKIASRSMEVYKR
jgi:cleavage and polyadenylation specificity factor subunit 3